MGNYGISMNNVFHRSMEDREKAKEICEYKFGFRPPFSWEDVFVTACGKAFYEDRRRRPSGKVSACRRCFPA